MADPAKKQLEIISTFVLRARRIAAHSLAADVEGLRKLAQGEFRIEWDGDETYLVKSYPPEEQVESAAARVRPLLLQKESTYWSKVMNALGFFVRDNPHAREHLARLKEGWRRVSEADGDSGQMVQVIDAATGTETALTSDMKLAYAYIYGDVIHHDEQRLASVQGFDIQHRFEEAATLVGRIIAATLRTLQYVEELAKHGVIPLPPEAVTTTVVVTATESRHRVRMKVAPVGMQPPASMSETFGAGWTAFTPDLLVEPEADAQSGAG